MFGDILKAVPFFYTFNLVFKESQLFLHSGGYSPSHLYITSLWIYPDCAVRRRVKRIVRATWTFNILLNILFSGLAVHFKTKPATGITKIIHQLSTNVYYGSFQSKIT